MTRGARRTPEDPQDDVDARFRDIVARFGDATGPERGDQRDDHPGTLLDGDDDGDDDDGDGGGDDDDDGDAEPDHGAPGGTEGRSPADPGASGPDLGTGSAPDADAPREPPARVNRPLGPPEPIPWRVHHPPPDSDDDHFEPPRPAPPPGHDAVFWTALVGCVVGPMWFLYLVMTDPYGSRTSLWAAGLLTLCGCALTVWRLPKRADTDPDDDGARV